MKNTLLCLTCFFIVLDIFAQTSSIPVYYTPVTMPAVLKNNYYGRFDTKLLAEDLAALLHRASGKEFIPMPYKEAVAKGIFLLLDSSVTLSSNEAGIIESDGKNFVRIKARYTTGISYAMYSWLEQLGFRFYLPGEDWTIIPSLKNIYPKDLRKKIFSPHFRLRMFAASGAMYTLKGLDENKQNDKDWLQWYHRNRMGSDYLSIDGHIGEVFNVVHQKEIEQDSTLVAPFNGKRQYRMSAKLDPTNKRGVAMFANWIAEEFKKEQKTMPAFLPFKKYYTADAGDGLNYCYTASCEKEFKTVSNQAFYIVNETARKIKQVDARAGVSTLAYGERADTPSFRIEPNVHVTLVASAFQSVTTQAELMLRWAKKIKNISQYDYLGITVWSYDNPFTNLYEYHNKLRFFQSLKIQGMNFETSLSKFGSGLQKYFILKFLCDPYQSIDILLDNFCKDNFENAATPVKKLLKEWYFSDVHLRTTYNYPSFYEDELGRFVQYLVAAENSPNLSGAVKKRIEELKAYTVYLCGFYEFFAEPKSLQGFANNTLSRSQKAEELLNYTWQLYETKIFHNTQLNDILKQYITGKEKEKWNLAITDHLKGITQNASATVNQQFEKIKKKYLPLAVPDYPITDDFLAANVKYSADSIHIATMDEQSFINFIYPVSFYCAGAGPLKVVYHAGSSTAKTNADKIAIVGVESADYKFIKTDFLYNHNRKGILTYFIPSKGHYKLYLSQYNATHFDYVIYPGKNLFYHNKKSIMMSGLLMEDYTKETGYPNKKLAFYSPDVDSIYFSNFYFGSSNTSSLYSASGKKIPVIENKPLFYNAAAIPADSKNNFIFYENSLYRWPLVLKNTASWYFFLKHN